MPHSALGNIGGYILCRMRLRPTCNALVGSNIGIRYSVILFGLLQVYLISQVYSTQVLHTGVHFHISVGNFLETTGYYTGWKEKFVHGYRWWILHLRFDENTCKCTLRILSLKIFFFLFCIVYSTHPRNHRWRLNSFSWRMVRKFLNCLNCGRVRANSDFMILDTWMSIFRNFRIRFH